MIEKPDIKYMTPDNFLDYLILYGIVDLKKELNKRYWELIKEVSNPKYETMEDLDIMEEKLKELVRHATFNLCLSEYEDHRKLGALKLKEIK